MSNTMMNKTMMSKTMINKTMMSNTMMNKTMMNKTMMNKTINKTINKTMMNKTMMSNTMMNKTMMNKTMMNKTMIQKPNITLHMCQEVTILLLINQGNIVHDFIIAVVWKLYSLVYSSYWYLSIYNKVFIVIGLQHLTFHSFTKYILNGFVTDLIFLLFLIFCTLYTHVSLLCKGFELINVFVVVVVVFV